MFIKRLLCLLGLLFFALVSCAQGVLKCEVADGRTGEPLPFARVELQKDGQFVRRGNTDIDGVARFRDLTPDTYDIVVTYVGYNRFERQGIRVPPQGIAPVAIHLQSQSDSVKTGKGSYGSVDDTVLKPLPQYEIVNSELKCLLDRVIEGKENTYFWAPKPIEAVPQPSGTTFDLYLYSTLSIDTTFDEVRGVFDYLYMLYRDDSSLPRPLRTTAPVFSFDSATTSVQVTTTYYPQTFSNGTHGFVEYNGRIFFLCLPHDEIDERFFRLTGEKRFFKHKEQPCTIWDPPTWIYTRQQGHWYRWMELPKGF